MYYTRFYDCTSLPLLAIFCIKPRSVCLGICDNSVWMYVIFDWCFTFPKNVFVLVYTSGGLVVVSDAIWSNYQFLIWEVRALVYIRICFCL
ncbi:hypothetical protein GDO78_009757 [Eleutherodactylus coqui]|uniref:Uncharacterized protein n=1 Tax=Eleutherodactylus coqui TaxID=57060 RepID=A0A8J6FCB3_ELECQ|nr:hypothetical protein GDO78_009757 [Eleutherodactylus coqui]